MLASPFVGRGRASGAGEGQPTLVGLSSCGQCEPNEQTR
jgi:hypothetical protein